MELKVRVRTLMAKRRSSLCDSQIVFDFGVPERASEAGDMAGFSKMVAGSVSKMLGQDGRDRQAIAKAMSQLMGERVSKEMLDAYASEARDEHNISAARWWALVAATGRYDIADAIAKEAGARIISGEEIVVTEIGHLQAEIAERQERLKDLKAMAKPVGRARGRH